MIPEIQLHMHGGNNLFLQGHIQPTSSSRSPAISLIGSKAVAAATGRHATRHSSSRSSRCGRVHLLSPYPMVR